MDNNSIIINLFDEASTVYEAIYSKESLTSAYYITDDHGMHVRAITIHDLVKFLYIGVQDCCGKFLVWREQDSKERYEFLRDRTLYRKNSLDPEYELLANNIISRTVYDTVMPFVMSVGSEYSILLHSYAAGDSLIIGVTSDIRIVEWEEALRQGKIAPSWVTTGNIFKSERVKNILSDNTYESAYAAPYSQSTDPDFVNAGVLLDLDRTDHNKKFQ